MPPACVLSDARGVPWEFVAGTHPIYLDMCRRYVEYEPNRRRTVNNNSALGLNA